MQKTEIAVNQQGKALSYIIGVYFGDGCVSRRTFHMKTIDKDFADYLESMINVAFPKATVRRGVYPQYGNAFGKKDLHYLDVNDGEMFRILPSITHNRTLIPSVVYETDANTKAFLEGILDSDGWVSVNQTEKYIRLETGVAKTGEFMHEVYKLFQQFGLQCQKMQTRKLKSGKILKRVRFNPSSFLNSGLSFHINRKQQRLNAYRSAQQMLNELKGASFNDYKQQTQLVGQDIV